MVFSTVLIDASTQVLGSLGKNVISKFISLITDWPDDIKQGIDRARSAKSSTEQSIKNIEDSLNDGLKLMTKAGEMKLLRKFGSVSQELTDIRHEIESKSTGIKNETDVKDKDILKAYTTVYLAMNYDTLVIETIIEDITNRLYDDDFELDDLFKRLRKAIRSLKDSWNLFRQVTADPKIAKSIYSKLKETRKELVEFMEEINHLNKGQMDMLVSGIVLQKPKVFGKKRYIESLSAILYETAKAKGEIKVSIPKVFDLIREQNPKAEFSDADLEKAANLLIENNRAYALTEEDNIKYIEFRKSDESLVCGNCSSAGGIYREYKKCLPSGKYVCDNCITFWGKCKICDSKVKKGQHPDI